MHRSLRLLKSNVSVAVTEVSEQITSANIASQLIIPSASYQIIPGHSSSVTIDIDTVLIWLLPLSQQQLIDIALPYKTINSNREQVPIISRYILFGRKLVGIRVCECKEWGVDKFQFITPSYRLQKYYRQNRIPFTHKQIPVGPFYLQLNNCRIGLLFQAELIQKSSLLSLYQKYKCDILSVMASNEKQVTKDQTLRINLKEKEILYRLKSLARQQHVGLVFAGAKIVPSLQTVFWEKSFIMQGSRYASQPRSLIGDRNFVYSVIKLDETQTHKWTPLTSQQEDIGDQLSVNLQVVSVDRWLRYQDKIDTIEHQYPANKRILSDFVGLKEITLYNIYYLYSVVNRRSPFVLPYPFSSKVSQLFNYILILEQHSRLEANQLVKIYSTVQQAPQSKNQIKVYPNFASMIHENKSCFPQLIYLYSDNSKQLRKLRESDEYRNKICYCQSLIPFAGDEREVRAEPTNMQILQSKKLENACVHVLKQRFQSIQQILSYFWQCHFNKKEIQKSFTDILPVKLKKFVKLTPLYLFLLHSSPEAILNEVGEAEIRLKQHEHNRSTLEEEGIIEIIEEGSRRLSQKIQAVRAFKRRMTQYLRCHRCQISFRKELTYSCDQCKNILCLDCLDNLNRHSLFSLQSYKCLICLGKCDCKKCQSRMQPLGVGHPLTLAPFQAQVGNDHPYFNPSAFECLRCQILGDKYDLIRIECLQCKQLKCYNCAKMQKDFDLKGLSNWICEECKLFNDKLNQKSISGILNNYMAEEDQVIEESVPRSQQQMLLQTIQNKQIRNISSQLQEKKIHHEQVQQIALIHNVTVPKSPPHLAYSPSSSPESIQRNQIKARRRSNSRSSFKKKGKSSSRSKSRSRSKDKAKDNYRNHNQWQNKNKKGLWGKDKPKGQWKKEKKQGEHKIDKHDWKKDKKKAFWSQSLKKELKKTANSPPREKWNKNNRQQREPQKLSKLNKQQKQVKSDSNRGGLIFESNIAQEPESFSY